MTGAVITDASSAPCCSVHTGFNGRLNEIECGCWIVGRGELLSAVPMCIVVRGRLSQLASRSITTLYSYLKKVTHTKTQYRFRDEITFSFVLQFYQFPVLEAYNKLGDTPAVSLANPNLNSQCSAFGLSLMPSTLHSVTCQPRLGLRPHSANSPHIKEARKIMVCILRGHKL